MVQSVDSSHTAPKQNNKIHKGKKTRVEIATSMLGNQGCNQFAVYESKCLMKTKHQA